VGMERRWRGVEEGEMKVLALRAQVSRTTAQIFLRGLPGTQISQFQYVSMHTLTLARPLEQGRTTM